jgi:high-affinity iron transporter
MTPSIRRSAPWIIAAALLGLCVWFTTRSLGVDPTETPDHESRTAVVVDSAIIVFREGLEAILIFAAVIAS